MDDARAALVQIARDDEMLRAGRGQRPDLGGVAAAARRGLQNMRIQAFLTAAAANLKRLAGAALAVSLLMLAAIADAIETRIVRPLASRAVRSA